MTELKPCPFCGGEAAVMYAATDDGTKTISVVCQKCSVGIFRARTRENDWNAWEKPEKAIEAWNRRAEGLPSAQPEIVRCRDCKHRIVNEHYGERGYPNLKAECEWDTGDPYGLGRNAEDDEWFCADGERRADDVDSSER